MDSIPRASNPVTKHVHTTLESMLQKDTELNVKISKSHYNEQIDILVSHMNDMLYKKEKVMKIYSSELTNPYRILAYDNFCDLLIEKGYVFFHQYKTEDPIEMGHYYFIFQNT